MFEKYDVLIAKWSVLDVPKGKRDDLVKDIIGKPVVIYVAGVRQPIGIVRAARVGRDGIFGDLVLAINEQATPIMDHKLGVIGFKEITVKYTTEPVKKPTSDSKDLPAEMQLPEKLMKKT